MVLAHKTEPVPSFPLSFNLATSNLPAHLNRAKSMRLALELLSPCELTVYTPRFRLIKHRVHTHHSNGASTPEGDVLEPP